LGNFDPDNLFDIIMKKTILTMAVLAFLTGTITTSYGQNREQGPVKERENVQEASRNRNDVKQDFKREQQKSVFEYQKFKKEAQNKIRKNEKKIGDLKMRLSKFQTRERSDYQRNLRSLEQKNNRLKKKLANYREKEQNKWFSFKRDFDHDIDEVTDGLRDFRMENKR